MRTAFRLGAFALAILAAAGCTTTYDARKLVEPTEKVVGRHDDFVRADESLSEADRAAALGQSEQMLRDLFAAASVEPFRIDFNAWQSVAVPVCVRHNAYLDGVADKSDNWKFIRRTASLAILNIIETHSVEDG